MDIPRLPALVAAVCLAAAGLGVWRWLKTRPTPQEIERRRRLEINARGKLGDGHLVEVHADYLMYSYEVRGVAYTASQDVSALAHLVPPDAGAAMTPAYVKYDPRNPANSIVLCEEWSGLPERPKSL